MTAPALLRTGSIACCLLLATAIAQAAPPWKEGGLFKKLEANPDNAYPLTEDQGPWMIMAVTFSGEEADDQAKELVHELRSRFKLAAYTHEVDFDYSNKSAQGRGARMKYRVDQIHEIAVLVGDYSSYDDAVAQKTLRKLKHAQPDCLDLQKRVKEGKKDSRSLAALRLAQQFVLDLAESDKKNKGPMGHAFITTNPLLSDDYFVPKGVDKLVEEMNSLVKFSLLDCPGRYTCKVATFTGNVVIDQNLVKEIQNGAEMPSRLEEAEVMANQLTIALRQKGYEAYQFHDRYSSIVTVGSFNSVGTPLPDGRIEIDPQLHAYMQTFGAEKQMLPGQAAPTVGQPKSIARIPFDIQPMPVEVPRRAYSRDYDRANDR